MYVISLHSCGAHYTPNNNGPTSGGHYLPLFISIENLWYQKIVGMWEAFLGLIFQTTPAVIIAIIFNTNPSVESNCTYGESERERGNASELVQQTAEIFNNNKTKNIWR